MKKNHKTSQRKGACMEKNMLDFISHTQSDDKINRGQQELFHSSQANFILTKMGL